MRDVATGVGDRTLDVASHVAAQGNGYFDEEKVHTILSLQGADATYTLSRFKDVRARLLALFRPRRARLSSPQTTVPGSLLVHRATRMRVARVSVLSWCPSCRSGRVGPMDYA